MPEPTAQLRPLEALEILHAFRQAWGSEVVIEFGTECDKYGHLFYVITARCEYALPNQSQPTPFVASSRWPNSSHSTMLGLMVWLAHSVDAQIDAAKHLAQL